ncbi:MAG TPA: glycoside hydrolase family 9 protein [Polyangiaceae bacterium]|nr:glycoside hydrolase family 9 protein [Polyangiaceae bacterium]
MTTHSNEEGPAGLSLSVNSARDQLNRGHGIGARTGRLGVIALAMGALAACSNGTQPAGRGGLARGGTGPVIVDQSGSGGGGAVFTNGGSGPLIPNDGQGAKVGSSGSGNTTGGGKKPTRVPLTYCLPEPFPKNYSCKGEEGSWAEALQKVLWFFNVNKSGPGVYCTDVQWRGDAHVADGHIKLDPTDPNGVNLPQSFIDAHRSVLDPDGNNEVDLAGGYHDAGDYIKFTLTTTYAASMIAWSLYEYPESFTTTSLAEEAMGQVRWASDYLMKATFRDENGKLVAFAHQVSDVTDHSCFWMPPEVRRPDLCPRKAYFVWDEKPAADVTAAAAATLALTGLVTYQNRKTQADVDYAERCISYAKSLYEFASRYPEAREGDDNGLYLSNSSTDDLAWAAIWLYLVNPSQNGAYLDAIVSGERPWLSFGAQANLLISGVTPGVWVPAWAESSPHSWDAVRAGVIVKLAQIMAARKDPMATRWVDIARQMALGFKTGGSTPDGLYVYMSWGSARYNAAAQFTTLLFTKYFPDDPETPGLLTWANRQIDYILGDNNLGKSYVMGYTDSYPLQPHHAAGHASIYGLPAKPAENRHIIWGALVNGPKGDGTHVDARDDYGSNEVTIDYNGALVAALAAHYPNRGAGQCPLKAFPPLEKPIDEFYAMANLNMDLEGCRTQVSIRTMNESIHPPRYDKSLTTRYWFNATEVIEAGLDPTQAITGQIVRDTGMSATPGDPTEMKGPIACDTEAGVYYFEFDYTGSQFWGLIPVIGAPRDVLLDYGVAYNPGCPWNPENDWSIQYLKKGGVDDVVKTPYVTVYSNGQLIWGKEPPCMGGGKEVEPPPPEIEYPPR